MAPYDASPLHVAINEKFRRAIGEPHRAVGKDRQWSLRTLAYIAAINVLVNGSVEHPVVWIFDPHDPEDGVCHTKIVHESDADDIIKRIEARVRNAGRGGSRSG